MADENSKEMPLNTHRRMVNCILRKDIIGGYFAIQDHFELIDRYPEAHAKSN